MKNIAARESSLQAPYLARETKEGLYGESLASKMLKNEYADENKRLKTKMRHLENKLEAQMKQTEFVLKNKSSPFHLTLSETKASSSQTLVLGMKRTIKDMQSTVEKKDTEIAHLKRSIKLTECN